MPPVIIYEDSDLLVLNKPAGLTVHKTSPTDKQTTLVDWLLEKYPQIKEVGDPIRTPSGSNGASDPYRPGIVHRLDKETSGLMVVAKTQAAFSYLKEQFQTKKIKKQYLALVFGQLKNQSGLIDKPLGKLGTKQTTQIKGKTELDVKEAQTEYKVLEEYNGFSLLEVRPLTGRTHQIRVHLNSIGHPIVGDSLYGGKHHPRPAGLERMFLHAQKLEFTTLAGEHLTLEADPPLELTNFLNYLRLQS